MKLGIYGAGGLGKEICDTALMSIADRYEEILFIDDAKDFHEYYGKKVLTFEIFIKEFSNDNCEIIIGVGEPSVRSDLFQKVNDYAYRFATIIHPTSVVSSSCTLGQGVYIGPFSFVSSESSVGDNVIIQPHAMIGHDAIIGFSTIISSNVVIAGKCSVGKRAYIALNVSVEQNVNIGDDSIIGMASCVNRDIQSDVIAMGYPARVLKKNDEKRVF
jgi:sugar O-acyltransferase (sialic acid O-acetyltransferase NeuD family)